MRSVLLFLALLACPFLAMAAELPSIDTPLKTGLSAKGDAAVVVGVENYVYLPQATYAARDADAMYQFLVYTRGVPSSRVTLLQGGTSRRKIIEAVTTAGKQVGPGGTVWVYFAGHGAASPTSRERIVLPENTLADAGDFDEQGVPVAELQRLAGEGGGDVLVITDACFTGAGRAGGSLLADGRSWVPSSATAKGKAAQWDATTANQVAGPIDSVQHGAFTYFAIGAMRGWADGQLSGTRDGTVSTEEAQLYVQEALRAVGIRDQSPSLVGSNATARTLATGVKERRPELLAPPAATFKPPEVVKVGDASVKGGSGFQAELEKAKREAAARAEVEFREKADAEAKAREAEKSRLERATIDAAASAARKVKLDEAETTLKRQATADWSSATSLIAAGGPEATTAANAFVKAYDGAKITVDAEVRTINIPEVALAKKVASAARAEGSKAVSSPAAEAKITAATPIDWGSTGGMLAVRAAYLRAAAMTDKLQRTEGLADAVQAGRKCLAANRGYTGSADDGYGAAKLGPADAECAYWTAVSLWSWSKLQGISTTLKYLPETKALLSRVTELTPDIAYGGPDRFWGTYYASIPSFAGQDLGKSKTYFTTAMAAHPDALQTHVDLCEFWAVKSQDRKTFHSELLWVLEQPTNTLPGFETEQRVAQSRAKALLAQEADFFAG